MDVQADGDAHLSRDTGDGSPSVAGIVLRAHVPLWLWVAALLYAGVGWRSVLFVAPLAARPSGFASTIALAAACTFGPVCALWLVGARASLSVGRPGIAWTDRRGRTTRYAWPEVRSLKARRNVVGTLSGVAGERSVCLSPWLHRDDVSALAALARCAGVADVTTEDRFALAEPDEERQRSAAQVVVSALILAALIPGLWYLVPSLLPFSWCTPLAMGVLVAWHVLPMGLRRRANDVGTWGVMSWAMVTVPLGMAWSLGCLAGGRLHCIPSFWCCAAGSLWLIAVWDILVRWEARVQGDRDARWLAPEHGGHLLVPLWAAALLAALALCGAFLALQAAGVNLCMGGSVLR